MITFLVTQERIEQRITVKEYIGMTGGNVQSMISVMSKFVMSPSGYMDEKEAYDLLGDLTISELKEAFTKFSAKKEDAIVSPTSAALSDTP
jgi:hypothetical protein